MPHTIEAFFTTSVKSYDDTAIVQLHREFLQQWKLTASQVPLLLFDPDNWDAPFSAV